MALISNFANAGSGIVTDENITTRRYIVEADQTYALTSGGTQNTSHVYELWLEIKQDQTLEWVGLTQTCAESQLTANAQPAQVTGEERCYNYEVQEDLRVVHSYKLIRKYSRVLTYMYQSSFMSNPLATVNGNYSFSVTAPVTGYAQFTPSYYMVQSSWGGLWAGPGPTNGGTFQGGAGQTLLLIGFSYFWDGTTQKKIQSGTQIFAWP